MPQAGQWPRRTPGDEACTAGRPRRQAKPAAGTVAQATLWAPAARRQVRQWQMQVERAGRPIR